MSDFIVFNPAEMRQYAANSGDTVHINVPAITSAIGSALKFYVQSQSSADFSAWEYSGTENIDLSMPWGGSHSFASQPDGGGGTETITTVVSGLPIAVCQFNRLGQAIGDTTFAILACNGTAFTGTTVTVDTPTEGDPTTVSVDVFATPVAPPAPWVKVVFHWVDPTHLSSPVSWMPVGVLDLQWELYTGWMVSASMQAFTGLKQGSDIVLGVIPTQAAAAVTTVDVTALSAIVRLALDPKCYGPLLDLTPDVAAVTSGDNTYFALPTNLSSSTITTVFSDLNDALTAAIASNGNVAAAQAAAASIACVLELRVVVSSKTYTSLTFPFNLLQQLTR